MRLMVLGGSSNQLDLIKKAKQQGDTVILVDYLPNCPGRAFADVHIELSTFDVKEVTEAARAYAVQGIVTAGTDQPVLTAAIASEALGLRFYADSKTALTVTNKRIMKRVFNENDIPCTASCLIREGFSDSELSALTFPVVLKPVDSQGQRGVYRLNDIEQVRKRLKDTLSFSRETAALVEEYYDHDEITVNGWVHAGRTTILSVVDRLTMNRGEHIGICFCHHSPSVHSLRFQKQITEITERIVEAFHIQNGPIYFQYLVGSEGIKVNEIAMRVGGAYEGITLPIIAGLDILKMVIDYAKNKEIDKDALEQFRRRKTTKYLSTQLFFCRAGKIAEMTPIEKLMQLEGVRAVYTNIQIGDRVPPITDATARAGYFIVEGIDYENMLRRVNSVYDHFKIINSDGKNLLIAYSEYAHSYRYDG